MSAAGEEVLGAQAAKYLAKKQKKKEKTTRNHYPHLFSAIFIVAMYTFSLITTILLLKEFHKNEYYAATYSIIAFYALKSITQIIVDYNSFGRCSLLLVDILQLREYYDFIRYCQVWKVRSGVKWRHPYYRPHALFTSFAVEVPVLTIQVYVYLKEGTITDIHIISLVTTALVAIWQYFQYIHYIRVSPSIYLYLFFKAIISTVMRVVMAAYLIIFLQGWIYLWLGVSYLWGHYIVWRVRKKAREAMKDDPLLISSAKWMYQHIVAVHSMFFSFPWAPHHSVLDWWLGYILTETKLGIEHGIGTGVLILIYDRERDVVFYSIVFLAYVILLIHFILLYFVNMSVSRSLRRKSQFTNSKIIGMFIYFFTYRQEQTLDKAQPDGGILNSFELTEKQQAAKNNSNDVKLIIGSDGVVKQVSVVEFELEKGKREEKRRLETFDEEEDDDEDAGLGSPKPKHSSSASNNANIAKTTSTATPASRNDDFIPPPPPTETYAAPAVELQPLHIPAAAAANSAFASSSFLPAPYTAQESAQFAPAPAAQQQPMMALPAQPAMPLPTNPGASGARTYTSAAVVPQQQSVQADPSRAYSSPYQQQQQQQQQQQRQQAQQQSYAAAPLPPHLQPQPAMAVPAAPAPAQERRGLQGNVYNANEPELPPPPLSLPAAHAPSSSSQAVPNLRLAAAIAQNEREVNNNEQSYMFSPRGRPQPSQTPILASSSTPAGSPTPSPPSSTTSTPRTSAREYQSSAAAGRRNYTHPSHAQTQAQAPPSPRGSPTNAAATLYTATASPNSSNAALLPASLAAPHLAASSSNSTPSLPSPPLPSPPSAATQSTRPLASPRTYTSSSGSTTPRGGSTPRMNPAQTGGNGSGSVTPRGLIRQGSDRSERAVNVIMPVAPDLPPPPPPM